MLDVLRQKCSFKGIPIPTLADIEQHRDELAALWQGMLNHQLPSLPPYESFWAELPAFFQWLAGGAAPIVPAAYMVGAGETVLRERVLRFPLSGSAQSSIEVIRFAAANRLLVELDYDRSTRRIEPYSLRQTKDGNIVLHAFNVEKDEHRSYRVDRITGARVTNQTFVPRYEVELASHGPVRVAPTAARPAGGLPRIGASPRKAPARSKITTGPTYIYQCPYCQKKFRRERMDPHLNPHKNEWGGQCSGRTGYFVEMR
jgi:hypothetical protein